MARRIELGDPRYPDALVRSIVIPLFRTHEQAHWKVIERTVLAKDGNLYSAIRRRFTDEKSRGEFYERLRPDDKLAVRPTPTKRFNKAREMLAIAHGSEFAERWPVPKLREFALRLEHERALPDRSDEERSVALVLAFFDLAPRKAVDPKEEARVLGKRPNLETVWVSTQLSGAPDATPNPG